MNKILTVAMVVASTICLSSCNKNSPPPPAQEESATQLKNVTEPEAAPLVGVFQKYEMPANIVAGGHCFLDAINSAPKENAAAKIGQDVSFGGWVADANNQVPVTALLVIENAGGAYAVPMVAGAERPDVAAALANDALMNSGYNVIGKLEGVLPGEYNIGLVLEGSTPFRCELNAKLSVIN